MYGGPDCVLCLAGIRECIMYGGPDCVLCLAGIRECIVCGALATFECKDCYLQHGQGLNTTAFCAQCSEMVLTFYLSSFLQVHLFLQSASKGHTLFFFFFTGLLERSLIYKKCEDVNNIFLKGLGECVIQSVVAMICT